MYASDAPRTPREDVAGNWGGFAQRVVNCEKHGAPCVVAPAAHVAQPMENLGHLHRTRREGRDALCRQHATLEDNQGGRAPCVAGPQYKRVQRAWWLEVHGLHGRRGGPERVAGYGRGAPRGEDVALCRLDANRCKLGYD
jgi:hypothetical protein